MSALSQYSLSALAERIGGVARGSVEKITGISLDSRRMPSDGIFVAIQGTVVDGHEHVDGAFEHGAVAAIVSDELSLKGRPGIVVSNTRKAASAGAALFAGEPSQHLRCVGVTGTNGKTTTTWFLTHILSLLGEPAFSIGTLGVQGIDEEDIGLTTPDAVHLQKFLQRGHHQGMKACVMESSSMGLHQSRTDDVSYDAAVFTNLTRDHLDDHHTMEAYFAAKRRLFELLESSSKEKKIAVINIDDEHGRILYAQYVDRFPTFSYGIADSSDILIQNYEPSASGSKFHLIFDQHRYHVEISFIGIHNAFNIAAAFGVCVGLGYAPSDVVRVFRDIPQVPGRLEQVMKSGIRAYIDYSHTPDSLERALLALQELPRNKLWVVFGCGGDRDKGKRPIMGEIAARLADEVIVTSDNPRGEDPEAIIAEIVSGISPREILSDRREAIREAIRCATPGDVVLVAGKGHEDYQIIGSEKLHFSDREEVEKAFAERL